MDCLDKRTACTLFIVVLLINGVGLAFSVREVNAAGTIYIRSDGSVDPSSAPISRNGNIYTLTATINGSGIVIQRDNVILDGAGHILQGGGNGNGAAFLYRNNVTIRNMKVVDFSYGIWFNHCTNSGVSGNNVTKNTYGVVFSNSSSSDSISGNSILLNAEGIQLTDAGSGNIVSGNSVTNSSSTGIELYSSTGSNLKNTNVTGNNLNYNHGGIQMDNAPNNFVQGNQISNSQYDGIRLNNAVKETISGNTVAGSQRYGIALQTASNNSIFGNKVMNSKNYGIYLFTSSSNNVVYHNSFTNNYAPQAYVDSTSSGNTWDKGYPIGGNYWQNVPDHYSGPSQNQAGSDGIGDHPIIINSNNYDHYPLTKPYGGQHDIGLTSLSSAQSTVDQGYNLNLVLKILNYAVSIENRNISFYANSTTIRTSAGNNSVNIVLPARNTTILYFNWNTTGWALGSYVVSAYAPTAAGETDTSDNSVDSLHISITRVISTSITPDSVSLDIGQSQLFNATVQGGVAPYTYQWYLDSVIVPTATGQTWNFTPNISGFYSILANANDSIGFKAISNIANVTASPALLVNISPAPIVIDIGQSELFSSSVSGGTGPYFYQWYVDGNLEPNATGPTWTFIPTSVYTYGVWVIVTDSATIPTSAQSNIATTTVHSAPSVNISPSPVTIDVGQSQIFNSSVAGGTAPYSYQWYLNETLVFGANDPTWKFIPSLAGSYYISVTVTDDVSFATESNSAFITVNPHPTISINPGTVTMNAGQSQQFTSIVSGGSSPYTYQWYLDSTPVSGQTASSWVFTPTTSGSHIVYVIVVDQVGMQATSNNATVMVNMHDVAVTNIRPFKTIIGQGFILYLNVTVANMGNYTETFTVTVYANTAPINSQNVTLLAGSYANITFTWNTTGFAYSSYNTTAYASPVDGEVNIENNKCAFGPVVVTVPGDVNGDGKVNVLDLIMVARHLGQSNGGGYPPYSTQWYDFMKCDVNGDYKINILDLIVCAIHLGQHS